jgi:hypothetical protein
VLQPFGQLALLPNRELAIPCVVASACADLDNGARMLWDYYGGRRTGSCGFMVDKRMRDELLLEGINCDPCQCCQPCLRNRWFPTYSA